MVFQKSNKINVGRHISEETKEKIRQTKLGSLNPNYGKRAPISNVNHTQWKGDGIGSGSYLHRWVRRHLPQPEICPICKIKPPYDLANITGVYKRGLENWQYQCRTCHMTQDGRMKNLLHCRIL